MSISELRQLELAIRSLESQRALLGDAVTDAALGPLRSRLAELRAESAEFGASQDEREARALAEMYGSSQSRALTYILIDRIREQAKASKREFRVLIAAITPRARLRPRRTR